MLWSKISYDKKEWSYGVFQTVNAVSRGDAVVLATGTYFNTNWVTQPATATFTLFVGLVLEAGAAGDKVKVQTYGPMSDANVFSSQTTAGAIGNVLQPTNAADYLTQTFATTPVAGGHVVLCEAITTDTTAAEKTGKNVFIRAV